MTAEQSEQIFPPPDNMFTQLKWVSPLPKQEFLILQACAAEKLWHSQGSATKGTTEDT